MDKENLTITIISGLFYPKKNEHTERSDVVLALYFYLVGEIKQQNPKASIKVSYEPTDQCTNDVPNNKFSTTMRHKSPVEHLVYL